MLFIMGLEREINCIYYLQFIYNLSTFDTKREDMAKASFTDKQQLYIDYIVSESKPRTEAARLAGFTHPRQAAYDLTNSPKVIARIQQERQKLYQIDLANIATATLKEIITDTTAPSSARIAGVRTVLEVCNMIGKHSTKSNDNRALAEMSPEQLAGLIDTLENTKMSMSKQI